MCLHGSTFLSKDTIAKFLLQKSKTFQKYIKASEIKKKINERNSKFIDEICHLGNNSAKVESAFYWNLKKVNYAIINHIKQHKSSSKVFMTIKYWRIHQNKVNLDAKIKTL